MWAANILMAAVGIFLLFLVVTEKPLVEFLRRPKT